MSSSLDLRPYGTGDEEAILDLFEQSFTDIMTPEFWRWRFANAPAGEALIQLAWDGDRLAAHYAVTPVELSVDGYRVRSALSGTTMTHPAYRGRGLFPLLAERTYEAMVDEGMELVWGFPNRFSHRGFVETLDWRDIYELPMLRGRLGDGLRPGGNDPRIGEVQAPDERFDRLWERVAPEAGILTIRDATTVRWRYVDNPMEEYRIFTLSEGEDLRGYVIFKGYGNELQVVDLLYDAVETGLDLVLAVVREASARDRESVSLWMILSSSLHRALEKHGFHHDQPVTYWGARGLDDRAGDRGFFDFRRWHLTLGDSDVF